MISTFSSTLFPPLQFGADFLVHLPRLTASLGSRVCLVHGVSLQKRGLLEKIMQALAGKGLRVMTALVEGEPTVDMVDRVAGEARSRGIDVVVAIGGGSVLDTGKSLAALAGFPCSVLEFLEGVGKRKHPGTTLPWIAVPTTAGTGSETTTNAVLKGVGEEGIPYKRSIRHPSFLPRYILLDPTLQIGLPRNISAACAMDALSQLLESHSSDRANPLTDALTFEGLRHSHQGLCMLERGVDSLEMRRHLAFAALCSGFGLGNAGLGLVHGVAGLIGGMRSIPHGVVCGTLIAPAFAATIDWLMTHASPVSEIALEKFTRIAELFTGKSNASELPRQLAQWVETFELPRLGAYGFTDADLQDVANRASNRNSAAQLDVAQILAVLRERL
ncbi:MAG TPA: iron-containing alcohol dehydrogenase [Fibrobacteraceae bacterium]|nr:iron-containing alcohol dehydrogenase [Fibrobacteraceae bacterium]